LKCEIKSARFSANGTLRDIPVEKTPSLAASLNNFECLKRLPVAPASAASTAATPAVAAAPATTTAASRAAPATATAATFTLRASLVHHNFAALEILAVQRSDGFFRFAVLIDLNKSETSKLAGEAISNKRDSSRRDPVLREQRLHILFRRLKRKIAHIQFLHWLLLRPRGRTKYARLKRQYHGHGQSERAWPPGLKLTLQQLAPNLAASCFPSQQVSIWRRAFEVAFAANAVNFWGCGKSCIRTAVAERLFLKRICFKS
jgi:uncharacterized C2H2 Zn-finger protein